jgi:glucose-fructose oxidoreductase
MEPQSGYSGNQGKMSDGTIINFPYDKKMQQPIQLDNDCKALLEGRDLLVPGEEGLNDIRVVEAIYKSVASGREVKI